MSLKQELCSFAAQSVGILRTVNKTDIVIVLSNQGSVSFSTTKSNFHTLSKESQ